MAVPSTEAEQDFIIAQREDAEAMENEKPQKKEQASVASADEFDLSDITATPHEPSREDIIAAAEAAAFSEN